MNKLLKLTDEYNYDAKDIAAIHYGYCLTFGKVTYTTGIAIKKEQKVDNILLMVGNDNPIFYWCHVEKQETFGKGNKGIVDSFDEYSPKMFREQENTTWFIFDKMELISNDLITVLCKNNDLFSELFEKERLNHKNI